MRTVTNFWTKPDPLDIKRKDFSFGYTDDKGKKFEYKVETKDNDIYSFQSFVFALLKAKEKKALPWTWTVIKDLKNRVKIINPADKVEQTELGLKAGRVARRSFYENSF